MQIIQEYVPRNYAKEYYYFNPYGQYPMFVATSLGVKPCYDDWINVRFYKQFIEVCKKYGLYVMPDVIFSDPVSKNVVGKDSITKV